MAGHVALVLHAHLPYVRHPEHARPLEERWLHEALWESYLPLVEVLDRLAADGVRAGLTISLSPPLAAMLADDLLRRRFADHLQRLARLAAHLARGGLVAPALRPALAFYERRIGAVHAVWDRIQGDLTGALSAHARTNRS